ncbi:hypothetical protein [Myxosarcina sp. GI1]|uniref:hypothetical protein n=1 Tax=Myxosarcina sp. GI1 TaxID=1541065 RepID=UPI000565ED2D|nr:hypothetical protein [Myxosarcina sp. GI1]
MHLGYYIHLHGSGHARRAKAISQHFDLPVTFIGTGVSQHNWEGVANYQLLDLPPDKIEYVPKLPINQNCQTHSFHYAPYYAATYRQRAVKIANWVEQKQPTAIIVDVSAEITQFLRFLGVPVIGVRQHGERSDLPHVCGYDAAYKLFATYPQLLEVPQTPNWIKAKTIYAPGFSRYSERCLTKSAARAELNISPQQQVVLVLNGRGGNCHSLTKIAAVASVTPDWLWLIVGETDKEGGSLPHNLCSLGWCEDTYLYLKAADVAIASGGNNTVMEIGTARIPFLCIPEFRPFDEQKIKAKILERLGLCLVANTFPDGNTIKTLLARLKTLDVSKWNEIMAVDGAARAAKAIELEIKLLDSYLR